LPDVEDVMKQLNASLQKKYGTRKKFDAPQLMCGTDLPPVGWVPTGLLSYDFVNGGGGPRGKIEQIYGRRSSGKTTLVLKRIAEAQRLGLVCAYIDAEHELDKLWATKLGVNMEKLILHIPDMEPADVTLEIVESMLIGGGIDLIVLDSLAVLGTQDMLDKGIGDKHYAGISGLLEMFYKKVVFSGVMYHSDAILILINQPREVIRSTIPMERLPGGRALSHMSAIITHVKRGDYLIKKVGDKEEEKIGIEVKIINEKNKVRPPFRESTARLQFEQGFNPLWEVVLFGQRYDIIEKSGNWMYYGDVQLGNGVEQTMAFLVENAQYYVEIKQKIREQILKGR
jgi:recombination protein RecA